MKNEVILNTEENALTFISGKFDSGYWMGILQSVYKINISFNINLNTSLNINKINTLMNNIFGEVYSENESLLIELNLHSHPEINRLTLFIICSLDFIGMPIKGGATAIALDNCSNIVNWIIGIPALNENIRAHKLSAEFAIHVLNEILKNKDIDHDRIILELSRFKEIFKQTIPSGINTLPFIEAAKELNIPWHHVANNVFQFGWGSRSRWLSSTFTDQTSAISVSLARDKVDCAKVLRDVGLPVPNHLLVSSVNDALKVAEFLGYPVVVKPANLDGGLGVSAGVKNHKALVRAYNSASKLSNRIVVEQYIDGEDYRFRVCNQQVIGIVARRAASVVGNGKDSIKSLIEFQNTKRLKQLMPSDAEVEIGYKPIFVDEEVEEWLYYQDLTINSIIDSGRRVRLRGAANIMLGGTTWDVMRIAHQDNLDLALSAVKSLRLDIAGVDILLPDITKSWRLSGGAICEVNGQPQLPKLDAHKKVLSLLVKDRGRIPTILIDSLLITKEQIYSIIKEFENIKFNIHLIFDYNDYKISRQSCDVDASIMILNKYTLETSWPFDYWDLLISTKINSQKLSDHRMKFNFKWIYDEHSFNPDIKNNLSKFIYSLIL